MESISKDFLVKTVKQFSSKKIAVIGDLILDKYIFGKVSRISPEAPVPVVEVKSEKTTYGGAANVASNIADLSAYAYIVSVVGKDQAGTELLNILKLKDKIKTEYVIESDYQQTVEKTRIIADHQQIARIDKEKKFIYNKSLKDKIIENLIILIKNIKIDALIISDYGKGIISPEIIKKITSLATKSQIPVFVDPKVEHFPLYRNITSMTPNVNEAFGGMRHLPKTEQSEVEKLGVKIVKKLKLKSLIITQGENGMTVFDNFKDKLKITHIPTVAKEVYDVTGAGDTVISTLALAYSCSRDIYRSAVISNYAAGIVVSKLGTATTTQEELINEILK